VGFAINTRQTKHFQTPTLSLRNARTIPKLRATQATRQTLCTLLNWSFTS